MKTKVYLVRHAEAMGNVNEFFQGRTDCEISPKGKKQLDCLAERFRDIHFDALYSSPLSRTRETAAAVNRYHGLDIIYDPQLIEINGGEWEGKKWADIPVLYPEEYHLWTEDMANFRTEKGEAMTFTNEEMAFGYRSSRLSQLPPPCAATSVTVCLTPGDPDAIRATMRDFAMRRREKQPLSQPSCGSTFKRPQGHFAGTLIDQCGLKGARIGGASVSTLHAGFLVNDRNGTAADYLALIAHVQNEVLRQTGVRLEPEVRVIGKESPATAL